MNQKNVYSYVQAGKQVSPLFKRERDTLICARAVVWLTSVRVCMHAGIALFRKGCVTLTNALAWRPRQR